MNLGRGWGWKQRRNSKKKYFFTRYPYAFTFFLDKKKWHTCTKCNTATGTTLPTCKESHIKLSSASGGSIPDTYSALSLSASRDSVLSEPQATSAKICPPSLSLSHSHSLSLSLSLSLFLDPSLPLCLSASLSLFSLFLSLSQIRRVKTPHLEDNIVNSKNPKDEWVPVNSIIQRLKRIGTHFNNNGI